MTQYDKQETDYWNSRANDQNHQKVYNEMVKLAGIKAGDIVIDLACGTGQLLEKIAKRGAIAIGVDSSDNCLELAITNLETAGIDVRMLQSGNDIKTSNERRGKVQLVRGTIFDLSEFKQDAFHRITFSLPAPRIEAYEEFVHQRSVELLPYAIASRRRSGINFEPSVCGILLDFFLMGTTFQHAIRDLTWILSKKGMALDPNAEIEFTRYYLSTQAFNHNLDLNLQIDGGSRFTLSYPTGRVLPAGYFGQSEEGLNNLRGYLVALTNDRPEAYWETAIKFARQQLVFSQAWQLLHSKKGLFITADYLAATSPDKVLEPDDPLIKLYFGNPREVKYRLVSQSFLPSDIGSDSVDGKSANQHETHEGLTGGAIILSVGKKGN